MFELKKPELTDQVTMEVLTYPSDAVIKIRRHRLEGEKVRIYSGGRKMKIEKFSISSARRLNFFIRNTLGIWTTLLTLTYPGEYEHNGARVKAHLRAFIQFLRRQGLGYAWVLEFQQRGAPHFHFVLSGNIPKGIVAQRWFEIVGSGNAAHLQAGTRIEAIRHRERIASYLSKYLAKEEQKKVPDDYSNCGRFWGASRLLRANSWSVTGSYRGIAWYLRQYRKWNEARICRGWGGSWVWAGFGFTLRGGAGMPRPEMREKKSEARPLAELICDVNVGDEE